MFILVRTDLGTQRILSTEDIAYVDALNKNTVVLELLSKPGFDIRIGMGVESFLKVINGEEKFQDLYIDQGYQKTIENSSEELEKLEFGKETPESLERLEQFKEELTPNKVVQKEIIARKTEEEIPTFSKKLQIDAEKLKEANVVDEASDVW